MTTCVFCNVEPATTKDHIPPSSLFKTPRPTTLITVPACPACNGIASQDDEYFRDIMSTLEEAYGHPAAEAVKGNVIRSLGREDALGKRRAFEASIRKTKNNVTGYINLSEVLGVEVNYERLLRSAKRYVKGLFYHEFGEAVCPCWKQIGFGPHLYDSPQPRQIRSALDGCAWTTIGDGVFSYRYRASVSEINTSLWHLRFYSSDTVRGADWHVATLVDTWKELEEHFNMA